jgi:hypothetical protein
VTGNIDVFNGTSTRPGLPGNFKDRGFPAGFLPYNVQVLSGVVYVTYENGKSRIVDAFKQIYFTANVRGYRDGLLGAIQLESVPEPSTAVLGLISVGLLAARWQWKKRRYRAATV